MTINVGYQFNEKYAPYAAASIASLLENNRDAEEINVYILGENLAEESIDKLSLYIEQNQRKVYFFDTRNIVEQMKSWGMPTYRGSYAANMRLFFAEFVDVTITRMLYLDADTIVNGSLKNLMDIDLQGNVVAMAVDSLGGFHKADIGLEESDSYYNSGVILFDMDAWRKGKITEKIVDHILHRRAQYPSPDQDLLNIVCKDRILKLMPQYNFQPIHQAFSVQSYFRNYSSKGYYTREEIEVAIEHPVIYHFLRFVGEFPWNKDNVHPFNSLFDRYIMLTPWYPYIKQVADNSLILKIEKVMYKLLPRNIFLKIFSISHKAFYNKANRLSQKNKISKSM